nr:DUF938 domain-containing protein [Methylonatrum kenyense]
MQKPFSQACENNKDPILSVLRDRLTKPARVLEIGAGTGQHAEHFAAALPHLHWVPTDMARNIPHCRLRIEDAALPNLDSPLALDVTQWPWPVAGHDNVYSANTAHIMHWPVVEAMFRGVAASLPPEGVFLLYGPFADNGRHTSDSNRQFDAALRRRDPGMGVRDTSDLRRLAGKVDLRLAEDLPLPANNRILVFRRSTD